MGDHQGVLQVTCKAGVKPVLRDPVDYHGVPLLSGDETSSTVTSVPPT